MPLPIPASQTMSRPAAALELWRVGGDEMEELQRVVRPLRLVDPLRVGRAYWTSALYCVILKKYIFQM
jgi:hypothetical protein